MEEEADPFTRLQVLESRLFGVVDEVLQLDSSSSLLHLLQTLLEQFVTKRCVIIRSARVVSGGSLFQLYTRLEAKCVESENVAFMLGLARVCFWPDEAWFLGDVSFFLHPEGEESYEDEARNAMLALFADSLFSPFKELDSMRSIRLSVLRVFEQFQDEVMCQNFCLHLIDLAVASLFPQIEVWSHLVETREEELSSDSCVC